QAYFKRF
ncbi:amino acid kinase family protein, partial [Vibrio parahaemolyticus EKP-021]